MGRFCQWCASLDRRSSSTGVVHTDPTKVKVVLNSPETIDVCAGFYVTKVKQIGCFSVSEALDANVCTYKCMHCNFLKKNRRFEMLD